MTKILFVEDSFDLRNLIKMVFEMEKYKVTTAINGQEGLECAEKESFDVIVSDINMPVMDGIQFFRELAESEAHLPPFLFLTGHATDASKDLDEITSQYNAKVISKPMDPQEILDAVHNILGKP